MDYDQKEQEEYEYSKYMEELARAEQGDEEAIEDLSRMPN